MNKCACGSWAINHGSHGRDGSDGHLCDVCYWRRRAEHAAVAIDRMRVVAVAADRLCAQIGYKGQVKSDDPYVGNLMAALHEWRPL